MTKNKFKVLVIAAFLVIVVCCTQMQQPGGNNSNDTGNTNAKKFNAVAGPCDPSSSWITSPSMPAEVPNGGGQTFCDFHQFSWQSFLAMMNAAGGADRTYQDEKNFPLLLGGGQDSCAENAFQSRLFVRGGKDDDGPDDDFVLPEDIDQAAKNNPATIYDQNGNVVYYEVRFSRGECTTTGQMFPEGTVELKISYRVITEYDKPNYVWINADINTGKSVEKTLLGMIGFHLVVSTKAHPEFIWASFQHIQNAPECQVAPAANAPKWAFTSAQCAAQLPNSVDPKTCNFNLANTGTVLKGGPPTQICQVYHAGSKSGDPFFAENVAPIDSLNTQLTGPNGLIAKTAGASSPLSVLQNYQLLGTLWLIDPTKPSQQPGKPTTDESNQIGSLQLANPTMETTFQQFTVDPNNGDALPVGYTGNTNLQPAANCFFCHRYTPGNNVQLSHIFSEILGKKK
jgi:hypothetical protein